MKYENPQLRRMLAAEYTLGTLRGPARRRFGRLLRADQSLRGEVRFWDRHFGTLALAISPVTPPETVWIGLQRRLEEERVVLLPPARKDPQARASLRRVLAGLAAAAAIVLVVVLGQWRSATAPSAPVAQAPAPPAATYVAQLKMPDASMQWTLSLTPAHGRMRVAASGTAPALGNRSPELWWISAKGPVAIGVLPTQGGGELALPKDMPEAAELTLAVSLEPPGGSPTGQPTGPVVTSGAAVRAI